jgi:hypothetical protein
VLDSKVQESSAYCALRFGAGGLPDAPRPQAKPRPPFDRMEEPDEGWHSGIMWERSYLKPMAALGWIPDIRHPGLDPGSTTSTPRWIPDQVRDDEAGTILPVA